MTPFPHPAAETQRPVLTPEQWLAGADIGYGQLNGIQITDGRGYVLAVAIGDISDLDARANARLIAAAPDLLAALRAAEELWLIGIMNAPDDMPERVTRLRQAAIAKATGVTP